MISHLMRLTAGLRSQGGVLSSLLSSNLPIGMRERAVSSSSSAGLSSCRVTLHKLIAFHLMDLAFEERGVVIILGSVSMKFGE